MEATEELTAEDVARGVLVKNLAEGTSEQALEDFFSFCGEVDHKVLHLERQEAVVVFAEDEGRQGALLLNGGKILDAPVVIEPVPDGYGSEEYLKTLEAEKAKELDRAQDATTSTPAADVQTVDSDEIFGDGQLQSDAAGSASLPSLSGDWLAGVRKTIKDVRKEYAEVAREISEEAKTMTKEINDSISARMPVGVKDGLVKAKTTAVAGAETTRAKMADLDAQYDVSTRVTETAVKSKDAIAEVGKNVDEKLGISTAASSAAEASRTLAQEIDENLQISDRTRRFASQALDNDTVREGIRSLSTGWASLTAKLSPSTQTRSGDWGSGTWGSETQTDTTDATEPAEKADTATAAATEAPEENAGAQGGPGALAVD